MPILLIHTINNIYIHIHIPPFPSIGQQQPLGRRRSRLERMERARAGHTRHGHKLKLRSKHDTKKDESQSQSQSKRPKLVDSVRNIGPYKVIGTLGKGAFGTVYKGLNTTNGNAV